MGSLAAFMSNHRSAQAPKSDLARFFASFELYPPFVEAGELAHWLSKLRPPLLKEDMRDIARLNELIASGVVPNVDAGKRERLREFGITI